MAQSFDICIRGAGVVGRTLALLLARERLSVALVANPAGPATGSDVRAYALNAASRSLLEGLRTWPDAHHATPVARMEVAGDQDGRVVFDAATQGTDALAWIVDVPALEARLQDAVRFQPLVEMVTEPVAAPLTVVCEGRASRTREEFGAQFDVTPIPSTPLPHGWNASTPTGRWRASGLRQTAAFWRSCRWMAPRAMAWRSLVGAARPGAGTAGPGRRILCRRWPPARARWAPCAPVAHV
jgi:2-polyprenyl-6-methoxyphenol hydroxylase-like FAD-dependent oxidoreductase